MQDEKNYKIMKSSLDALQNLVNPLNSPIWRRRLHDSILEESVKEGLEMMQQLEVEIKKYEIENGIK